MNDQAQYKQFAERIARVSKELLEDFEPLPLGGLVHEPHRCLYQQVEGLVKDIEHWREEDPRTGKKTVHVAVVVTEDGACFRSELRYNPRDAKLGAEYQYTHRFGYEESVKRALVRCVKYHLSEKEWKDNMPHYMVSPSLSGRDLYYQVKAMGDGVVDVPVEHTHSG